MNIVFLSHTPTTSNFVVGSHHYLRELRSLGHNVIHIPSPRHLFSRAEKSKNPDEINLYSILPIGRTLFIDRILNLLLKISLKINLNKRNVKKIDFVIIDQPIYADLSIWLSKRYKAQLIYRPTDLYSSMVGDWIKRHEIAIIDNSKKIIATSKSILIDLQTFKDISNHEKIVIENGFDQNHFTRKCKTRHTPPKKLIYVGSLDSRFDYEALKTIGNLDPALEIDIYGPADRKAPIKQLSGPNISFKGAVDYNILPNLYCEYDAALLLMANTKANDGRSPMKIYEYLSSGLPVIARATKELRERNLPNVYLYNKNEDLPKIITTISEFLEIESKLKEQFWSTKAQTLLDFLKQ